MVAKHIDSFSVGLSGVHPMPLIPAPHRCPRQGKWGPELCTGNVSGHSSLQINGGFFFGRKQKKGAEEQLASSSRRGPRGPAAKANKEAT